MHFTMCLWRSDAQNAIGVAENGMAQGSPTLRISWLSMVFHRKMIVLLCVFNTFIVNVSILRCVFNIRALRTLCFTRVKIETMHFTMCFWHSDAQIAIGVAENGLAQGSPGRERPLRDGRLHWVWARGGGRAVRLKDLRFWGLRL